MRPGPSGEMVDAADSKSAFCKEVLVRVRPGAPNFLSNYQTPRLWLDVAGAKMASHPRSAVVAAAGNRHFVGACNAGRPLVRFKERQPTRAPTLKADVRVSPRGPWPICQKFRRREASPRAHPVLPWPLAMRACDGPEGRRISGCGCAPRYGKAREGERIPRNGRAL
jgi:hypothetical protein